MVTGKGTEISPIDLCEKWSYLTHWGRVTHICVGKLTIIGSDNGLSPERRQAIIWNNAGILFIGPSWTNFSEILIEIHTFSFKKMHLKISSVKWRPFCLGLNVLSHQCLHTYRLWHWEFGTKHKDAFVGYFSRNWSLKFRNDENHWKRGWKLLIMLQGKWWRLLLWIRLDQLTC